MLSFAVHSYYNLAMKFPQRCEHSCGSAEVVHLHLHSPTKETLPDLCVDQPQTSFYPDYLDDIHHHEWSTKFFPVELAGMIFQHTLSKPYLPGALYNLHGIACLCKTFSCVFLVLLQPCYCYLGIFNH